MNTLNELNNYLFAALERLDLEAMTPEQIEAEATRASAIVDVADRITENAKVQLQAANLFAKHGPQVVPMLPMIGSAKTKATNE